MEDVLKIAKSLKDSGIFLNSGGGFLGILLGTLGAS